MTVAAFTWQRYKQPLPATASKWRRQEKISVAKEQAAAHPYAGKSVLEILWEELDTVYEQLVSDGEPEVHEAIGSDGLRMEEVGDADEWQAYGELRGQAQGVAFAIAVLTNPYAANVPAVKALARKRHEQREAGEPVDPLH